MLGLKEDIYLLDQGTYGIIYNTNPRFTLSKVRIVGKIDFYILSLFSYKYSANQIIEIINNSNFLDKKIDTKWMDKFLKKYEEYITDTFCTPRNVILNNIRGSFNKKYNNRNRTMYPIMLSLRLTNRCDSKCIYCFSNSNNGNKEDLNFKYLIKLLDESKLAGLRSLNLTGGDPMLYPNIFDLILYLENNKFSYQISTKKILTDSEIHKLSNTGLKKIQFSIDSIDDDLNYHLIGKKDYFSKMSKVIEKCKQNGIKVYVNTVIMSNNIKEIKTMNQKLRLLGVDKHFLTPFLISKGRGDKSMAADEADFFNLQREITENSNDGFYGEISIPEQDENYSFYDGQHNKCSGGRYSLVINNNGDVTICERLLDNKVYIVGNVYEDSITNIWNGRKLINLIYPKRDYLKKTKCYYCENFEKCILEQGICYARVNYVSNNKYDIDPFCNLSEKKVRFH